MVTSCAQPSSSQEAFSWSLCFTGRNADFFGKSATGRAPCEPLRRPCRNWHMPCKFIRKRISRLKRFVPCHESPLCGRQPVPLPRQCECLSCLQSRYLSAHIVIARKRDSRHRAQTTKIFKQFQKVLHCQVLNLNPLSERSSENHEE